MKNLIPIFIIFLSFSTINAQTVINSNIETNTIWTKSGSPYLVDNTVTILENITLTISPGVVIKSDDRDLFHVRGTLIATGSSEEPIIFTEIADDEFGGDSNNDGITTIPEIGSWRSIRILETSNNTSRFSHCIFRYGGRFAGVIFADRSSPEVSDCLFEMCKAGWEVSGLVSPLLQNNHFEGITGFPVIISPGSDPVFSGNSFSNNAFTSIGLSTKYNNGLNDGDQLVLKKLNLGGINNISYIATHTLRINNNTTLTIQPGVVIKADPNNDLFDVYGTIIAEGTALEPIIFTDIADDEYGGDSNNDGDATSSENDDWGSIKVYETSGNLSRFSHCTFRFGGRFDGVLLADNSSPEVSNCLFEQCENGWEASGPIKPVLQNCRFDGITEFAVTISPGSEPVFSGNTFTNNAYTGIGLNTKHGPFSDGDQFTLKKIELGGIENIPYLAKYVLSIPRNAQLIINPGLIIKSYPARDLFQVYGALIALGTKEEPIILTHRYDDDFGGDSNNDGNATSPRRGSWRGIVIYESSGNSSKIENCIIRFGGNYNAALSVKSSSPDISGIIFENCEECVNISGQSGLRISNIDFLESETGLESQITNGTIVIDSSRFVKNNNGIVVLSGSLQVNNSEFTKNRPYDIVNNTPDLIDATHNLWDMNIFLGMINSKDLEDLPNLYDHFDNETYGYIDYSNYVISSNEIYVVSPGTGLFYEDSITLNIFAYPVEPDTRVVLFNDQNGIWIPEITTYIDSLRVKIHLDFSKAQIGKYDVWLITENDTLIKHDGFTLAETETPFGEWVHYETINNNIIISSTILPQSGQIYCLLKKATHIGYSSTWEGGLKIYKNGNLIANHEDTQSDFAVLLTDTEGGNYSFEINSDTKNYWNGYIKFCLEPESISLNEWETGEILRPYGSDWKVYELNYDVDEITIQTQGFGKWSTVDIFFETIDEDARKWHFENWGKGYSIKGTIQNAEKGKYFIKYTDSAVLLSALTGSDQSRDYLINVSTKGIQDLGPQQITSVSLSSSIFGQSYSSLSITGKGLSENTEVLLVQNGNIIGPVKLVYNENLLKLTVDYDFTSVNTGSYSLVLKNEISEYEHPEKITIEEEDYNPIGIQIIGSQKYRTGRHQVLSVKITNNSNINIRNGYIKVEFKNGNVILNQNNDFYTPEYKSIVNSAYEELGTNRELFFFSNLPPHQDLYLDLKMYSRGSSNSYFDLEVTCGAIDNITYNKLFSNYVNVFLDNLLNFPYSYPYYALQKINDLKDGESEIIFDIAMDVLNLNHFNHMVGFGFDKSLSILEGESRREDYDSKSQKTRGAMDLFNSITSWVSDGVNFDPNDVRDFVEGKMRDAATGSAYDQLPGGGTGGIGMGDAFGGPQSFATKLIHWTMDMFDDASRSLIDMLDDMDSEEKEKHAKSKKEVEFSMINSLTPEDKYGPLGASISINESYASHYIDTSAVFDYRVEYWNKEDATAPAGIVYIRDTLDLDFDLSTFNFTEIGFLKWKAPLEGGQYFNINVDTRPDMPYIVNVEGSVDPATREVLWVHTTLDPETMELTSDPEGGYLPPIDSTGYQIGWVSYTIKSKENLPDNTTFTNQAFVNFDGVGRWGPAPKEGPFTNIFDYSTPISQVLDGTTQSTIDSVLITWSGTDGGSGILDYTIYVSDGGEFVAWKTDISDTSAWFHGEYGKTYHFYSIARDHVGNIEQKEITSEHLVSFNATAYTEIDNKKILFTVFPNPSEGHFILEKIFANGNKVQIELYNLIGKKIYSHEMIEERIHLDLSNEPDGVYILIVTSNTDVFSKKLIKN